MTCAAAVALGQHHERAAGGLELVDVGVHPPGGGGAEAARRVALRGLGRTGVVHAVVAQVLRHRLAGVEPLLDLGVGDVAGHDHRARSATAASSPGSACSSARISSIGRLRSMRTTSSSARSSSVTSGRKRAGSASSCSRNTPSAVILPSAWRSAEHDTAMATGHEAPWRGSRMTRTSWQKYLPPNWAPMPKPCGEREDVLLELEVAEAVAARRARGGQRVEVAGRRVLGRLQRELGRRAADDDGEVVRRAGGGAERAQLLVEEAQHRARGSAAPWSPGTGSSCWPSRRPWP